MPLNKLWLGMLRTLFDAPDGRRDCPPLDHPAFPPALKGMLENDLVNVKPDPGSETGFSVWITPQGARAIGKTELQGSLDFMHDLDRMKGAANG